MSTRLPKDTQFTVIPGGLNALGQLYRDGQTIPACKNHKNQDPNAPVLHYVGCNTWAWRGGELTTTFGDVIEPLEHPCVKIRGYKVWSAEGFVFESNRKAATQMNSAGFANALLIDGVPVRLALTSVYLHRAYGEGPFLLSPYIAEPTVHGRVHWNVTGGTLGENFTAHLYPNRQYDPTLHHWHVREVEFENGELYNNAIAALFVPPTTEEGETEEILVGDYEEGLPVNRDSNGGGEVTEIEDEATVDVEEDGGGEVTEIEDDTTVDVEPDTTQI